MKQLRVEKILKTFPSTFFIACLIPVMITLLRWNNHDRDISMFVLAGDQKVNEDLLPFDIKIFKNSTGYDGQYFYQIALDPFSYDENGFGISSQYDIRKQRIFYPLLVYSASFGNQEIVPFMMVLVNLIAFFISFYFVQKTLALYKCNPNLVLLWALYTGSYIALSRNLAEVLAISLITMTIYFWSLKRFVAFAVTATFALLTRDDSLLVIGPFGLHLIWHYFIGSNRKIIPVTVLILPFTILILWKIHVISNYGIYEPVQFNLIPGLGILEGARGIWIKSQNDSRYYLFLVYSVGFLMWHFWTIQYAFKFMNIKKGAFNALLSICLLIWISLALFFNAEIYSDDVAFGRILSTLTLISFLMIVINEKKINYYYLCYTFGTFIVVTTKIIIFL